MAGIFFVSMVIPQSLFIEAQVLRPLGTSGRTFLVMCRSIRCTWTGKKFLCSDTITHTSQRVYKVAPKRDIEATVALAREWAIYQKLTHLQGVVIPEVNTRGIFTTFSGRNLDEEYLCLDIQYCIPNITPFIKDDSFKERFMNGIRAIHAAGYVYDREFDDCHIVVDGDSPRLVGLGTVTSGHDCPEVVWNGPDGLPIKPTRHCGELVLIEHVVYYEPMVEAVQ